MDILTNLGLILLGGVLLYFGAEWMVRGASGLARTYGVAPLVVGLTVVAYGTSAPELAVSISANNAGSSQMVLGNIVGSCVANLALILGITALIAPPSVEKSLIKRELPVLLASALIVPLLLLNGVISRFEACGLVLIAIIFSVLTVVKSKKESNHNVSNQDDNPIEGRENLSRLSLCGLTLVGLVLLVLGGDFFVNGAKGIASKLGMSDRLVGLTVVAIGTSLPELAASVVAALRGMGGLAVGNVVGSNIFNVFLVLGITGLFAPLTGDLSQLKVDLGFMIGLTILAILFMRGDRIVSRIEGTILVAAYITFITVSVLLA